VSYPDDLFQIPWGEQWLLWRPATTWAALVDAGERRRFVRQHSAEGPPTAADGPRTPPFRPRGLTVLLGGTCMLSCSYCYAREDRRDALPLDVDRVVAVFDHVLHRAFGRRSRIFVGLHGGCDPLTDLDRCGALVQRLRDRGDARGVSLALHATTGGILSRRQLTWAVEQLDTITVSWDGDPRDHDRQRPLLTGGSSHREVLRTLEVLRAHGKRPRIRATVTRRSITRIGAAAERLARSLQGGILLQLEPVFPGVPGGGAHPDAPEHEVFARDLIDLWIRLEGTGAGLETAWTRMGSRHGRHCFLWQDNLAVLPDGRAVGCFLPGARKTTAWGDIDGEGRFAVRQPDLDDLRGRTDADAPRCRHCLARQHCSRGCPQICPAVETGPPRAPEPSWCRSTRRLLAFQVLRRAGAPVDGELAARIEARIGDPPDAHVGIAP
jgi:radical SAM protein with 4Fe4S-binding SPASM domain